MNDITFEIFEFFINVVKSNNNLNHAKWSDWKDAKELFEHFYEYFPFKSLANEDNPIDIDLLFRILNDIIQENGRNITERHAFAIRYNLGYKITS